MQLKRRHFSLPIAALAVLFLAACVPIEGSVASENGAALEETPLNAAVTRQEEISQEVFPITVTYFTPAQTEGPYYPVAKPADRDNDLLVLEGADGRPDGDVLEFGGSLFDSSGMPVSGAVIEIWQTDDNGVYLHPGDAGSSRRDVNFQSYGEAVTTEEGSYSFRTIMPGNYPPRPRHIHVKVRFGTRELLTTQFYFSNDPEASQDRIFAGAGEEVDALIMEVDEGIDEEGNPALIGRRDIVLRTLLSE